MARPRSPNRDKALKLFLLHAGQIKNKEIAEILHEDPKTISKWKKLDKWSNKLIAKNKKNNSKKNENKVSYIYALEECEQNESELASINSIDELNEKQLMFCIYMTKYFNATKAYKKAYQCKRATAAVNGCKLLKDPNIKDTIEQLKANKINRAMLSPEDIFQKYMDIAFSDITDYVDFGHVNKTVMNEEGKIITYDYDYSKFKNGEDIDGSLITEIKVGKGGASVKLMDRLKALDWLAEHMNMATEEQKCRVESIKLSNKIQRMDIEIKKKITELGE